MNSNHNFFVCPKYIRNKLATSAKLIVWSALWFSVCLAMTSEAKTCYGFQNSPQAEVDNLKTKLDSLNEQLTSLETKINDADGGDLNSLQKDYQNKLEDLTTTISELKEKCLVAIEADPDNQKNVQTVMGILLNEADSGDDLEVLMACDRLIAAGIHPAYFEYAAKAGRIKIEAREIFDEALIRQREAKADDLPRVLVKTNKGDITIELYENEAPQAVANFISLVESGFYDDSLFYSVIESFRAQTGGPTKDNAKREGPGYTIYCECYKPDARPHFTHVVSMAIKSDRDTAGSQFIIPLDRTSELDGKHTVFGRIIDGHDVTEKWVRTAIEINGEATDIPNSNPDRIVSAEVIRKRDHKYKFRKVGEPEEEKPEPKAPPAQPETKPFEDEANQADTEEENKEDAAATSEESKSEMTEDDPEVQENTEDAVDENAAEDADEDESMSEEPSAADDKAAKESETEDSSPKESTGDSVATDKAAEEADDKGDVEEIGDVEDIEDPEDFGDPEATDDGEED